MMGEPLTLTDYRERLRGLPRPTDTQKQQFAAFVADAHSWYKHLPPWPPSGRLQFFLDPSAGMQLHTTSAGKLAVAVRETTGFHYSWIATAKHRDRFGFLAFSRSGGTSVAVGTAQGDMQLPSDDEPAMFDAATGSLRRLPAAVLLAGRATISGLVQEVGPQLLWSYLEEGLMEDWPEESGGATQLEAIRKRCGALVRGEVVKPKRKFEDSLAAWLNRHIDDELFELLEPERQRQQRGMVAAIDRVMELIDGPGQNAASAE